MKKGKVKWFNERKGYGFINVEDKPDEDIFVHYSSIEEEGYRKLSEGESVEFDYEATDKGPVASRVKKLNKKEK